jgi:deoxycytidylate deaminase
MKRHEKIFSFLEEGLENLERVANARVAAAVVHRGCIVSIETNQFKSHPFQALYSRNEESVYWHAETNAIHSALRKLSNRQLSQSALYVCRLDQSNNRCLAKPCEGCMKAIRRYKIKRVFYTTSYNIELDKV